MTHSRFLVSELLKFETHKMWCNHPGVQLKVRVLLVGVWGEQSCSRGRRLTHRPAINSSWSAFVTPRQSRREERGEGADEKMGVGIDVDTNEDEEMRRDESRWMTLMA